MDEEVQYKSVIIEPRPVESGGKPGRIAGCVLVKHFGNVTHTRTIDSEIILPTREEAVFASIELCKHQIDGSPLPASVPAD
jgi:hypothetical protein